MAEVTISDSQQNIFNNALINSNGSTVFSNFGCKEISVIINITQSPTGTLPTLQFTLQEIDPGDFTTTIGNSINSNILNSISSQIITLPVTKLGSFRVSWVVGGTSPSFDGVYANVITKIGSTSVIYNSNDIELGTQSNPFIVKHNNPTSSVLTNISASTSNNTLLNSNNNRLGATFFNDSSNNLYLKLGTTASTSSFTVKILSNGYYELPFQYTGIIDGIWDGTNGAVRITELYY